MFHTIHTRLMMALAVAAISLSAGTASAIDPLFAGLTLVDEVNCGNASDPHTVTQSSNASTIQMILGRQCRVMAPTGSDKYFSYRLGQNKGLVAGKAYILLIEYPEDQPRSMWVINSGCEQTNGYHTGTTVGDALSPQYVNSNPESLSYPLSGQYQALQMFFSLHHRYVNIQEQRDPANKSQTPVNGFAVTIAQFKTSHDPKSAGAAVARIALYEAPAFATYSLPINFPPSNLPRRHLFWREEMSDQAIGSSNANYRSTPTDAEWYEYKAKLSKFLGMNTFSKDLLEFGHNQGWDSAPYGGNNWYYQSSTPQRWPQILDMLRNYDLDVLPYYEYAGSIGGGAQALGTQRRCRPLGGTDGLGHYTQVTWSENAYVAVIDPAFVTDVQRLLDCTQTRMLNKGKTFVGAWLRTRNSNIPADFSDAALAKFAVEVNGGVPVTRAQIGGGFELYDQYMEWWNGYRRQFLIAIRDYLRTNVNPQADVLFTWDAAEAGTSLPNSNGMVISEELSYWSGQGKSAVALQAAIDFHTHYKAMIWRQSTWGGWEWQHSLPAPDPQNYHDVDGVMLTHTFNKTYTVADPVSFDAFRSGGGLAAIRHYCLNENDLANVGYFVGDMNLAGPYEMSAEAQAVANGDPTYIGYLAGSSYNRCFPQYVRNFNQAFLSLPALPSAVVAGAASSAQVVVRAIYTDDAGTYVAVVNNGMTAVSNVSIVMPQQADDTADAAVNTPVVVTDGVLTIPSMYPYELRTFRVFSQGNMGPLVSAGANISSYRERVTLNGSVSDDGNPGTAQLTMGWSKVSGPGDVTFVNPGNVDAIANFSQPGTYVLRLTASDGAFTQGADVEVTYYIVAHLEYERTDLGGGLYGWRFYIANPDELLMSYTVSLGFEGTGGAAIQQVKSSAVHVNKEGWKEWDSEYQEWNGEGAILCDEVDPAYDMNRDTWASNVFANNPAPGINPLTGGSLTGIANSPNAFAMSCFSGTGSTLGDGVNVAYVVASGNVTWKGTIFRNDQTYIVDGITETPAVLAIPGDFNGDGVVTHGDYTLWADHYGQSIADVRAENPAWFPPGSYPLGATAITQGLYTVWADNFGGTSGASMAVSSGLSPAGQSDSGLPAIESPAAAEEPLDTGKTTRAEQRRQRRLERRAARDLRRAVAPARR